MTVILKWQLWFMMFWRWKRLNTNLNCVRFSNSSGSSLPVKRASMSLPLPKLVFSEEGSEDCTPLSGETETHNTSQDSSLSCQGSAGKVYLRKLHLNFYFQVVWQPFCLFSRLFLSSSFPPKAQGKKLELSLDAQCIFKRNTFIKC